MQKRITANIAIVWLIIAVFIGYLAIILWASYQTYESRAGDRALSLVRLVEQHATEKIDRANSALLEIKDHLLRDDFSQGVHLSESRRQAIVAMLMEKQKRSPGVASISLADSNGIIFANSLGVPSGVSLGDRRYFLDLKAQPHTAPVVSEVVKGQVSNKWGIHVARRVDASDGSFGGVIVANLGVVENF